MMHAHDTQIYISIEIHYRDSLVADPLLYKGIPTCSLQQSSLNSESSYGTYEHLLHVELLYKCQVLLAN